MDKKISQKEFDMVVDVLKRIGALDRDNDKSVLNQMAVNAMKKVNPGWNGYMGLVHDIDRAIQGMPEEFAKKVPTVLVHQAIGNFHQLDKSIELVNFLNRAKQAKKEDGAPAAAPVGTTTMSANVGLYPVPIGSIPAGRKKKKHEEAIEFASKFARDFSKAKVGGGYDLSKLMEEEKQWYILQSSMGFSTHTSIKPLAVSDDEEKLKEFALKHYEKNFPDFAKKRDIFPLKRSGLPGGYEIDTLDSKHLSDPHVKRLVI